MQHVPRKWLSICNAAFAFMNAAFIVIFAIRGTFEIPQYIQEEWGISLTVAIIAGVHLVYICFIYPFINKRITWIANIISFGLAAMVLSSLIDASGNTNLVYRLAYAGLVFLMGMTGVVGATGVVLFTWVALILTITGTIGETAASLTFNIIIDLVVTAAGLFGWLIFRRFYVNTKTHAEVQLTNLLREEKFKSNIIIESITDGVMIVNQKGTVQLLNKSAASMLGWGQNEALHLDYKTIIKPEETQQSPAEQKTAIEQSIASGKSVQQVTKLETRNQHRVYVDIVASPIYGSVEKTKGHVERVIVGTIAVLRDVDTQKREEQKRSDFISTASHEMRTPVASIQGFVELALNPKVTTIDDKARQYLEKADEATKHLGELFQDLLTVSQSDDGRLTNTPEIIEVGEFMQAIVEEEQLAAEKKGLKLTLQQQGGEKDKKVAPLIYVHVDPERLREVMFNIVGNAIKYTKEGMVTVGATSKGQSVVIRVSDTGMGIAQEDIPHLFQKFYRTDNSATREIGGTGLGLYICRQIVEMMNGKIWVESTLGTGSTFFVEIPRTSPEALKKTKLT